MDKQLSTIEKVVLLQQADVFEFTSSEDLAKIAYISEEVFIKAGQDIYQEGDLSDSMYMVVQGGIQIRRNQEEITTLKAGEEFGAWSLFDDEVRVVTATSMEDSHLLKIHKEDFFDLLAENLRITQGILKKLSRRLRSLVGQLSHSPGSK